MDASQKERELRRYAEGREKILETVMRAEKKGKMNSMPYQNYLIRQVIEELVNDIRQDVLGKSAARAFKKYAQYLSIIDPKIAALRAIQAVLGVLLREGAADIPHPVWRKAAYAAGQAVYAEYLMQAFKGMSPALYNALAREYSRSMTRDERHILTAFKAKFRNEGYAYPTWGFGELEQIGNYVLTRMVEHRFLESWSRTERHGGRVKTVQYVMLDEYLRGASLSILDAVANAPHVSGPLIEPPLNWDAESNQGGGFHTPEMQRSAAYAVQGKGVGRVAENTVNMLNTLQRVQWQINGPVLDAVRIVGQRLDFGDVVSPDAGPKPEFPEEATDEQKKTWKAIARKWYTEKKMRGTKHMRAQKVFREAQELRDYSTLWFSYYADFRGRAYARSASVSPQGTDLEKGVLMLKVGKPILGDAVQWFKSAGANRFGLDKVTLDEQLAWVDSNDAFIIDMGTDPTTYTDWTKADSPVQFLAWAMEYAKWREDPSYLSHLPMSQDGTCNGLQHFSALMRDEVGGAAVNLMPACRPRDIYSDVADRVVDVLEARPDSALRTGWLAHGVSRKLTKRPTMTLPYGSTRFAASTFVMEYIEDEDTPPLTQIPPEDWGDAANYMSYAVWDGMGEVVKKALEVMSWLQAWAKHAVENGKRVAWVAPSGLHVVSEYDRMQVTRIKSKAFGSRIQLYKPSGKVDLKKTMNAVAPNFVHSLDSSHMARVIQRAEDEGIEVVAIHDDFGTHAADTPRFREIIRQEFIDLYADEGLLDRLAESTGFPVPPPERGSLNLKDIADSMYFFF